MTVPEPTRRRGPFHRLTDLLFEPRSTAPMAAFRVALGLIVLVWAVSLAADVVSFFGPDQIAIPATGRGLWSVFGPTPSTALVLVVYAATIAAAVAVVLGYRTRVAAIVMWLALLSFSRRDPWVYNSGDALLRVLAFYLVLMPAGDAYSLDVRRRTGDWTTVRRRAPWPLWLVRIQVAALYVATAMAKMPGTTWADGTAVGVALRLEDLARIPVPAFVTESLLVVNLLTFFTLAFELTAGFLIWPRATRRYVLGVGVLLHGGILLFLQVGPFSWGIFAAYLAFVDPEWIERFVDRWRNRGGVVRLEHEPALADGD